MEPIAISNKKPPTGTPNTHFHKDDLGFTRTPHEGQVSASELMFVPHSLHATIGIHVLPRNCDGAIINNKPAGENNAPIKPCSQLKEGGS